MRLIAADRRRKHLRGAVDRDDLSRRQANRNLRCRDARHATNFEYVVFWLGIEDLDCPRDPASDPIGNDMNLSR
jgi:hypothetical protein